MLISLNLLTVWHTSGGCWHLVFTKSQIPVALGDTQVLHVPLKLRIASVAVIASAQGSSPLSCKCFQPYSNVEQLLFCFT
jgi:hypothetical protein